MTSRSSVTMTLFLTSGGDLLSVSTSALATARLGGPDGIEA